MATSENDNLKRERKDDAAEAAEEGEEDEGWVGPMPTEAQIPEKKKRKVLIYEKLFRDK